jgi:site-specific recombinase XerD
MYTCGLRISEAATLQVRAIDGINGFVRVIGKGNKERCVPLRRQSTPERQARASLLTATTTLPIC